MKTVGIIGGIGPESTVEYYRLIIAGYRQRLPDGSYPKIIVNSIDLNRYIGWANADQWNLFTDNLAPEIEKLARAGVDFAVMASNTPHIVFDELRRRSPIPLVSIVETACEKVQQLNLKTVGLFGTRFTMRGNFYQSVFSRAGIRLALPDEESQNYIHEKYMGELLKNVFLPETHSGLLKIVDRLIDAEQIEALILGGTELPLILRESGYKGVPFLDTTRIHVDRIVAELLT